VAHKLLQILNFNKYIVQLKTEQLRPRILTVCARSFRFLSSRIHLYWK